MIKTGQTNKVASHMIIGIGTDIVEIKRIERITQRYGGTFLKRCFTQSERDYASTKKNYIQALASAWATKEAVAKALATGISSAVTLKSISLHRTKNGAPKVILSDGAYERAVQLATGKMFNIFVSISHDKGITNAFAIIEV